MGKARTWSDREFREAVESSHSIASVLRKLGLRPLGGNYKTVYAHISRMGLDDSHFTGQSHNKDKTWSSGTPLDEILVENSTYTNTARLRIRLVKEGYLLYECQVCKINEWQEKPLVLHLDHMNGVNTDHRLGNLRLLCPNCHSQTETYCRGSSPIGRGR